MSLRGRREGCRELLLVCVKVRGLMETSDISLPWLICPQSPELHITQLSAVLGDQETGGILQAGPGRVQQRPHRIPCGRASPPGRSPKRVSAAAPPSAPAPARPLSLQPAGIALKYLGPARQPKYVSVSICWSMRWRRTGGRKPSEQKRSTDGKQGKGKGC